ncbi:MAG: TIGR02391 family protein [Candidatus Bathyarchaeota archaeon]|nr:TIGR02391 family protein [Candidatus Bathyarchaeota archaeon]
MTDTTKLPELRDQIKNITTLITHVAEGRIEANDKEKEYTALSKKIDENCVACGIKVPKQFPSLTDFFVFFRSKLQTTEEKSNYANKIYEKTLEDITNAQEKTQPPITKEDEKAQALFEQIITHPEIKTVSAGLFNGRNYRNAVLDAAIRLEEMIKKKANYPKDNKGRELSGVSLMHRVFDSQNPILSWTKNSTQIDKDELDGYKLIFAGTVQGIRDTKAHAIFNISPMRALKLLTLIVVLAELVDSASII